MTDDRAERADREMLREAKVALSVLDTLVSVIEARLADAPPPERNWRPTDAEVEAALTAYWGKPAGPGRDTMRWAMRDALQAAARQHAALLRAGTPEGET
jgi:hypothetical protein